MTYETIKMEISANPEYVSIIRLTTSGIANKVGFCLDDIEDLKVAIKEERYEDAAKIRDEIKKMSK